MEDQVVLVDVNDRETGVMGKMEAHLKGELHRAISVLVFNDRKELLLQQRSFRKYHTPGLWSNTCCSHPWPGETTEEAAIRRLTEEMGFTCPLTKAFDFVYKAPFDNGLTEHEFDHVYFGSYNQDPLINPEEAHAFKWISLKELISNMRSDPQNYTVWFRLIMEIIEERRTELIGG